MGHAHDDMDENASPVSNEEARILRQLSASLSQYPQNQSKMTIELTSGKSRRTLTPTMIIS